MANSLGMLFIFDVNLADPWTFLMSLNKKLILIHLQIKVLLIIKNF